jgi:hypothetical protein
LQNPLALRLLKGKYAVRLGFSDMLADKNFASKFAGDFQSLVVALSIMHDNNFASYILKAFQTTSNLLFLMINDQTGRDGW